MKKLIFALFPLFAQVSANEFPTWEISSPTQTAFMVAVPSCDDVAPEEAWDCFTFCTLQLPALLERAHVEQKKVLLLIPDNYQHTKTTQPSAPLTEGARVAMAWISAYYRFYDLDATILICSSQNSAEHFIKICNTFLTNASPTHKESIHQRVLNLDTIPEQNQPDDLCFYKKVLLYQISPQPTLITPELPEQQPHQKRILITGGAGFIGSHLAERYLLEGHQVIILDDFSCCTQENLTTIKHPNLFWYKYDVSNPFSVEGPIDTVFHLASYPSPVDYYQKPIQTMRAGLHGTRNSLELALEKNARFVMGSTSEVYGDPHVHPQPEAYAGNVDPIGKRSQYDQSKRGAETWCKYYFDTYNLDIRIMRIFNTYGPRMRLGDGRVVTNFIKAALENSSITIHGTGDQTRSFGFVSDTVDGIYRVAESNDISSFSDLDDRIFNVGNPGEFSINQVAEAVNTLSQKLLGNPTTITHIPQFDMSDPQIRCPNISHIQNVTGYNPTILFKDGLQRTFQYFQALQK